MKGSNVIFVSCGQGQRESLVNFMIFTVGGITQCYKLQGDSAKCAQIKTHLSDL